MPGARNKHMTGGAYEFHIHRTYIINAGTYHIWENFEEVLANYFS